MRVITIWLHNKNPYLWIYSPPQTRAWDIWGSYHSIPKAVFYLLKGDYICMLHVINIFTGSKAHPSTHTFCGVGGLVRWPCGDCIKPLSGVYGFRAQAFPSRKSAWVSLKEHQGGIPNMDLSHQPCVLYLSIVIYMYVKCPQKQLAMQYARPPVSASILSTLRVVSSGRGTRHEYMYSGLPKPR